MGNRAFEGFVGQNRHRTFAEGMTTFAQGGLRQVLKSPYQMCRLHPALGQYRLLLELLSETKEAPRPGISEAWRRSAAVSVLSTPTRRRQFFSDVGDEVMKVFDN